MNFVIFYHNNTVFAITIITIFDFLQFYLYTLIIMKLEYILNELTKYQTVKQILKEEFLLSDRLIIKLKNSKQIYLNNIPVFINHKIEHNDNITVDLDFEEVCENIVPTKMNLDILYEDDGLLIINKPHFIPVHPSMDHYEDSLSNGVKYYFDSIGLKRKIRPVNRLDKNTSGIVIFAKNEYIQECLIRQMKFDIFEKEYIAILEGNIDRKKYTINVPISRKENSIIERCVSSNGDNATTIVELIKNYDSYSLVKCYLKTGRTHQIRVHTSYIGHPILGDDLYGNKSNLINRQALHAYKISFIHPLTKRKFEIDASIPNDIKKLIHSSCEF